MKFRQIVTLITISGYALASQHHHKNVTHAGNLACYGRTQEEIDRIIRCHKASGAIKGAYVARLNQTEVKYKIVLPTEDTLFSDESTDTYIAKLTKCLGVAPWPDGYELTSDLLYRSGRDYDEIKEILETIGSQVKYEDYWDPSTSGDENCEEYQALSTSIERINEAVKRSWNSTDSASTRAKKPLWRTKEHETVCDNKLHAIHIYEALC